MNIISSIRYFHASDVNILLRYLCVLRILNTRNKNIFTVFTDVMIFFSFHSSSMISVCETMNRQD